MYTPRLPVENEKNRKMAPIQATRKRAAFLFFSFSTGKRGVYIIPLYPAAAILVARLLARAWESGVATAAARRLRAPLFAWAAAALLLAAGPPVGAGHRYPGLTLADVRSWP